MSQKNKDEIDKLYRVVENHDDRITENERFRLRAEGALTIVGFMLGSGFAVTILLYILGVI